MLKYGEECMRNYSYKNRWQKLLTPEMVSLLTQIHEYKGELSFITEMKLEALMHLAETAKMQSIEASNKIEGIYAPEDRLKSLATDKTIPRTQSEQEIAGYRDVLLTINESHDFIPIKPPIILQLHRDLYKFSGKSIGGSYKNIDNYIAEEDSEGNRFIRFQPVPAFETPAAIDAVCDAFVKIQDEADADPLLIIPMFILDFLCIHPFNDGNGRMSRLLTLLLLYRAGHFVGKYISIENMIEQSKEVYYEVLQKSSANWHEDKNDYIPFVQYTLGIILAAYRELSSSIKLLTINGKSKPERIREIIENAQSKITKTEIMEKCPDISQVTIQRALNDLLKSGEILKIGGGRYTAYLWNQNKESRK